MKKQNSRVQTRVKRITVSNLKAISDMEADFNGATAIITGGNNMGKSSFLRSLPDRIRGIKPDVILKFGERAGFAEWELTTGEKFIWTFDQTGHERLQFITTDDIKQSVTKEIAQRYFPAVFDVDEFLSAGPKKQKQILQQLVGLDFTDIDKRYKAAYDERTFKNRQAIEERARVTEIIDLPVKEIPYFELEKELAGIDSHSDKYKHGQDRREELFHEHQNIAEQIMKLQQRQKETLEKLNTADAWLADKNNQPKDNADELTKKIAKIKKQNEAIKKNNEAIKQEKLAIKCELEHKEADQYVKKIEQERMDMISNAKIPEGFTFSEDGIMYKDLPFTKEQLSSSGIYIAALKLANMTIGEVRTLHFDASFLDKKSLQEIEKWAEKNKLQLLIEVVDREGEEITYELIS